MDRLVLSSRTASCATHQPSKDAVCAVGVPVCTCWTIDVTSTPLPEQASALIVGLSPCQATWGVTGGNNATTLPTRIGRGLSAKLHGPDAMLREELENRFAMLASRIGSPVRVSDLWLDGQGACWPALGSCSRHCRLPCWRTCCPATPVLPCCWRETPASALHQALLAGYEI